jgi:acylphosphatase
LDTAGQRERPEPRSVVRWLVSGRVQGVGFRWFVVQAARRCGVVGDVRNLNDGRVEVRAQGQPAELERLRAALQAGPPAARVARVEALAADAGWRFERFDVRE